MNKGWIASTLSAAIGGIVVVVVTNFLYSAAEQEEDVKKSYISFGYNSEFSDEEKLRVEALIGVLFDEERNLLELKEGLESDEVQEIQKQVLERVNWWQFTQDSVWGEFGALEYIEVQNNEPNRSVDVLVEGKGAGIVFLRHSSDRSEKFEGTFSSQQKILPKGRLEIVHVGKGSFSGRFQNGDSESILVSVNGKYLEAALRKSALFEVVGPLLNAYPLVMGTILFFGCLFLPLVILQIAGEISATVGRYLVANSTERSLAHAIQYWQELETENPAKFKRIGTFVEVPKSKGPDIDVDAKG